MNQPPTQQELINQLLLLQLQQQMQPKQQPIETKSKKPKQKETEPVLGLAGLVGLTVIVSILFYPFLTKTRLISPASIQDATHAKPVR